MEIRNSYLEFCCPKCSKGKLCLAFIKKDISCVESHCSVCGSCFSITDPILLKKLKNFNSLCEQIYLSQDILGSSAIGVNVNKETVKVPFNILLTRFPVFLELKIKGKLFRINFVFDPLKTLSFLEEKKSDAKTTCI